MACGTATAGRTGGLLQFQVPLGFLEELEAVGHLSDLSEWCGEDCSIM